MKWLPHTLFVAWIACVPLQAAVIITTWDGGTSGTGSNISTLGSKAVAFTMPASGLYTIDDVQLRLSFDSVTPDIQSGVILSIWSNSGSNRPDTQLLTFTSPTFTAGSAQTFTFTPDASFNLEASTSYWLALENVNTSSLGTPSWRIDDGTFFSSSIGATAGAGGVLGVFGTGSPDTWNGTSSLINAYELNATLVPEPASGTLLLTAAAGLALIRGRRGHA